MALPAEVTAAFAVIGTYVGDDAEKAKEVAQAMRESEESPGATAVAQRLLTIGAGRKKSETDKTVKALEKERDEANAKVQELTEQAEAHEATKGKPSEKEAELERRLERATKKATDAEAALKAEKDGRKSDRVSTKALGVVNRLNGLVDPDYLEEVLTPRIQKRIRPTDEDADFLADDETPYEGDDKARSEALAADLLKVVPDKYRLRDMNPGGGANGRGKSAAVTVEQREQELAARGLDRL